MLMVPQKRTFYTLRNFDKIPQLQKVDSETKFAMRVVANVLPFRVNNYVVDELINWDRVPDDPMFQLTFPQQGMLSTSHFDRMASALRKELPAAEIKIIADEIRRELNPHPAGQLANVPTMDEEPVGGIQHKYRETCLVFPTGGQTCHAYCTYCFRWPQFVGLDDLKFATQESGRFQEYLARHKEISDVLVTGGDPMVMKTAKLARYLEPLLEPRFDHIQTIRIGTKSVAFWPHRFVTDEDSDDVLRLFEKLARAGKHVALMAHYNHWIELSTPAAREAIRRIRSAGVTIRTQSPVVGHVNDHPDIWARMWKDQVKLGAIPYYMFIARDTGAHGYFAVPLYRTWKIFRDAYQRVSGLGRTVRGPSMSCLPGKVRVDGVAELHGEKMFVLNFLQARQPDWVRRPFFAKFDPKALWLDDLKPVGGESKFFFEDKLQALLLQRENHHWQALESA